LDCGIGVELDGWEWIGFVGGKRINERDMEKLENLLLFSRHERIK
jgi:hypothetical protein